MPEMTSYSMLNVAAALDGLQVQGFYDGDDVVMVDPLSDEGDILVGADGSSIFSQSADQGAEITLKLQHTSPMHKHLTRRWLLQRTGRLLPMPFVVRDTESGEGHVADQCYIRRAPTDSKGKNATVREWILVTGQCIPLGVV